MDKSETSNLEMRMENPKLIYGEYGTLLKDIYKRSHFKEETDTELTRFNQNGDKILHYQQYVNNEKNEEYFSIKPVIIADNGRKFHIYFYCEKNEYGYSVDLRCVSFVQCEITEELYKKIKSQAINICNPDNEYNYNFTELINLFREIDNESIPTFFEHWNRYVEHLLNENEQKIKVYQKQ